MKHFDDNTKKLIKNVVSLITSALVLVAATIAWFTAGAPAKTNRFTGNVKQNAFSVSYYRQKQISGVLLSADTGYGEGKGFTFSNNQTIETRMDSEWNSTDDQSAEGPGLWDVTSMKPGSYDVFRLDVGNLNPRLIISGITCKDLNDEDTLTDAQKESVYKGVYLYAVALKKTTQVTEEEGETSSVDSYHILTDSQNEQCVVCGNLYDLVDKPAGWTVSGSQTLKLLQDIYNGQVDSNKQEKTTILLFVGVPGSSVTVDSGTAPDLVADHEALRQIGAHISFTSISVNN